MFIVLYSPTKYDNFWFNILGLLHARNGYTVTFYQILPVIPQSTLPDELNTCLKSSILWRNVKTLQLTTNMRVPLQNNQSGEVFSKRLLHIGNGKIPIDISTSCITFPINFCQIIALKNEFIRKVFPNIDQHNKYNVSLSECAILAARTLISISWISIFKMKLLVNWWPTN